MGNGYFVAFVTAIAVSYCAFLGLQGIYGWVYAKGYAKGYADKDRADTWLEFIPDQEFRLLGVAVTGADIRGHLTLQAKDGRIVVRGLNAASRSRFRGEVVEGARDG